MSMQLLLFDSLRIVVENLVLPPRSKGGETTISRCFETSGIENTRFGGFHGWSIADEATAKSADLKYPVIRDVASSKALRTVNTSKGNMGARDEIPEPAAVDMEGSHRKRDQGVHDGSQKRKMFPIPVYFKIYPLFHDIEESTARRSMCFRWMAVPRTKPAGRTALSLATGNVREKPDDCRFKAQIQAVSRSIHDGRRHGGFGMLGKGSAS
ncbi:hypothetical protein CKAH01_08999 [Colletotrichum kahawae]|uniref:Uncharacterized protein n=1 Tax=Colletotrichum kahawae TaxID=34407 RepID=A0AAD9Y114_COLKA|nr:hypothetical protein CKAH01_08999 [Colletotrichum kahawae]